MAVSGYVELVIFLGAATTGFFGLLFFVGDTIGEKEDRQQHALA